jgi:hypothetical protein
VIVIPSIKKHLSQVGKNVSPSTITCFSGYIIYETAF